MSQTVCMQILITELESYIQKCIYILTHPVLSYSIIFAKMGLIQLEKVL